MITLEFFVLFSGKKREQAEKRIDLNSRVSAFCLIFALSRAEVKHTPSDGFLRALRQSCALAACPVAWKLAWETH